MRERRTTVTRARAHSIDRAKSNDECNVVARRRARVEGKGEATGEASSATKRDDDASDERARSRRKDDDIGRFRGRPERGCER